MTRQAHLILASLMFFFGMCCIALALTVAPMGAHWLIWGLPAVAGLVDVVGGSLLIYDACKLPPMES